MATDNTIMFYLLGLPKAKKENKVIEKNIMKGSMN